jgi:hypothetical protein
VLTVRVIDQNDYDVVDALRITSYRRATWFTLKDAHRIRCVRDQPDSRVVAVFDGAEPVATICQTLVLRPEDAVRVLEMDVKLAPQDFPALVISRAGTAEGYTGLRLNHVLRWFTLHAALADGIESILGGHAKGTPNLRVMGDLGYRFVPAPNSTMSQVEVNTEHVMSYLPRADFPTAIARLQSLLAEALAQVRWQGPRLSFAARLGTQGVDDEVRSAAE